MHSSNNINFHASTKTRDRIVVFNAHPSLKEKELHSILKYNDELKEINLCRCQCISPQGFINANFPYTVKCINLSYTHITKEGLKHILASCPQLEILHIVACHAITLIGVLSCSFPKTLQHVIFHHPHISKLEIDILEIFIKIYNLSEHFTPTSSEQELVNTIFNNYLTY